MIVLDLSRLLSRAGRGTPTGIDRVELAYAEHLLAAPRPVAFAAMTWWGRVALLPSALAAAYVAAIAATWRGTAGSGLAEGSAPLLARRLRAAAEAAGPQAIDAALRAAGEPSIYLLVSHHHLENRTAVARLKKCAGAAFVCMIHDLIPLEFPEFAGPGQQRKHRRRIAVAAALADAIIVNSRATGEAVRRHLDAGHMPPILAAPLGADLPLPEIESSTAPRQPYFVCVGTIEARKNQRLLVELWRRLVAERGAAAPRLIVIGQRGRRAEEILGGIGRDPALRDAVLERNNLPDALMVPLLKGARALLLPSFAEGFGFPLVEALALGVPVLASGIAALRENGDCVPEYFDPSDASAWRDAVLDYAQVASARRAAQLRRLRGWRPNRWNDHFAAVHPFLAEVVRQTGHRSPAREPDWVAPRFWPGEGRI